MSTLLRPARLPDPSSGRTVIFLVAAVAFAGGCAGPPVAPIVPVKPMGPLSLEAAVDLAIRNNPDVKAAQDRIQAAQGAIQEGYSYYWPVLQVIERFTQTDQPSRAFGNILDQGRFDDDIDFNDPGVTNNFRTGLTGSITLYDGGRRRARILSLVAQKQAAGEELETVRRDIAYETARAYFLIHKAREASSSQEKSIGTLESHLRIAEARLEQNAVRRSDVLGVRLRLEETREAAIIARNAALRAEAAMRILLGLGVQEPIEILPPSAGETAPVEGIEVLIGRARRLRPEIRRAQHDVSAAAAKVREAKAGYFPEITVFGDFGFDSRNLSLANSNWFWGVSFIESIFDVFRTPYRVQQAMANLAAVHADGRKAVLAVELDVKNSRLDAEEADARFGVAGQAVELAEENMRLVEAEYREGKALVSRLLESELALKQARTRLSAATYDRALSRIAIAHATGEYPAPPPQGGPPPPGPLTSDAGVAAGGPPPR